MSQNNEESFIEKVKHLMSQVSIKTYLYALLVIGAIILIINNVKLGNKDYIVKKNSDTECRDPYGKIIKIDPQKGEGCVDIFGAAKDYGIDLGYIDTTTNTNTDNIKNENLTVNMSQDLALTNVYLEQNGIIDDTKKGELFYKIIENYKNNSNENRYTINDLKIIDNTNKEDIILYRKNIYLVILYYLTETKNISDFDMKKKISFNKGIINNLIKIPAIEEGSVYQLKLINLLAEQNSYFDATNKINTDPIRYLTIGGDNYINDFKTELESIIDGFDTIFKKY